MPTNDLAQIILALGTLATALGTIYTAWLSAKGNRRIEETAQEANKSRVDTKEKIEQVHQLTNSMKDQLVSTVAESERMKGIEEGRLRAANERGAAALARESIPPPAPVIIQQPAAPVPVVPAPAPIAPAVPITVVPNGGKP